MAPGVCVTSFRLFMRRTEFTHWTRRSFRLATAATTTTTTTTTTTPTSTSTTVGNNNNKNKNNNFTAHSWHLRGRSYCSDKKSDGKDSDYPVVDLNAKMESKKILASRPPCVAAEEKKAKFLCDPAEEQSGKSSDGPLVKSTEEKPSKSIEGESGKLTEKQPGKSTEEQSTETKEDNLTKSTVELSLKSQEELPVQSNEKPSTKSIEKPPSKPSEELSIKPIEEPKSQPSATPPSAKPPTEEKSKLTELSLTQNNVENTEADSIDITQLKVPQLKLQLRSYNLSTNGKRQVLLERLQNYLNSKSNEKDSVLPSMATPTLTESLINLESNNKKVNISTNYNNTETNMNHINNKYHNNDKNNTQLATTMSNSGTRFGDLKHSDAYNGTPSIASTTNDVTVEYINGLPHMTVPLPSRNEKCRFALKPISHRVGDLIKMLKEEDRGIDRATVLNKSGVRIASTCNIDSLLDESFLLQINDQKYEVVPPKREKIEFEDVRRLSDIRTLIAQLYEAMNVGEYHIQKENELVQKLEHLKFEIAPLERQKTEIQHQTERKTNIVTWVGLGLMSVQFGILARLTWWEYSWDIMEPITYFVTYGTAMAMYAYYCITKTEYAFPEVRKREYLLDIYKRAKKKRFDIDSYNDLRRQISDTENDIRRLHDPLNLQLPPHIDRAQNAIDSVAKTDDETSTDKEKSDTKKSAGAWSLKLPFLEPKK